MPSTSDQPDRYTLPITEAAADTRFFETAREFHGRSEIRLADTMTHRDSGVPFAAVNETANVRDFVIENAVLDGGTLVLYRDGLAILETAYCVPQQDPPGEIALFRLDDAEDAVIGCNNVHRGYQHWLTQCLPAIDWSLRRQRSRVPCLVLPKLEPWQEDFLRILGYDNVPRLTPRANAHYFLPRVEYSEFLNGSTSFSVCLSATETAWRIRDAVPASPSSHRILYVPCADPYYGAIRNEAAAVERLRQAGAYRLDRGGLSTADRINLFRNADVIVGPLGDGLCDIMFCKPRTLLWEWMPAHYQNASFNRLAQAGEIDYWGDLFDDVAEPETPGEWDIDLAVLDRRLAELRDRLNGVVRPTGPDLIADVLMAYESLGDNCEFGLVQRRGGAEPLGLLRFAGIVQSPEVRLQKLVAALLRRFEGLGAVDSLTVFPAGEAGRREYLVHDKMYDLMYHTGIPEGSIGVEALRERESARLGFLRRKLVADLEAGAKIWVWKSIATVSADQLLPLRNALGTYGPYNLLWAAEADADHLPGTVERLGPDLVKGYIARFAPYADATDISPGSWFEICRRTYALCFPTSASTTPEIMDGAIDSPVPGGMPNRKRRLAWLWKLLAGK